MLKIFSFWKAHPTEPEIDTNVNEEQTTKRLLSPKIVASWNDLPNEIKTTIVQYLGLSERLALRACSKDSKQSVDSVPFNIMDRISIKFIENGKYEFYGVNFETVIPYGHLFLADGYNDHVWWQYMTNLNYIRRLVIDEKIPLNLTEIKMKVGRLTVGNETGDIYGLINKLQPYHLKSIKLCSDGGDGRIYDLPQMILAKELNIRDDSCITNDQLLKLTALKINFNICKNLTAPGVNKFALQFIKNPKFESFSFGRIGVSNFSSKMLEGFDIDKSNNGAPIINTMFSDIQMNLAIVGRSFRGTKLIENDNSFSSLNGEILKNLHCSNRVIRYKRVDRESMVTREFQTKNRTNQVLIDLLNDVVYIKYLEILFDGLSLSSLEKKLQVGSISMIFSKDAKTLRSEDHEILRKADMSYLKEVIINRWQVGMEIFDIEQIINAERLCISHCTIQDDQLLKLNARFLEINNTKGQHITADGINKYLKKCLENLNEVNYLITINYCDYKKNSEKIFADFEYLKKEGGAVYIYSKWPNYILYVEQEDPGKIYARRIQKVW